MNFDTATIDECRDYIAAERCPGGHWHDKERGVHRWKMCVSDDWSRECPIPATLDAAAASLPEGWEWDLIETNDDAGWDAWCSGGKLGKQISGDGDTELLARFRTAAKAWAKENP